MRPAPRPWARWRVISWMASLTAGVGMRREAELYVMELVSELLTLPADRRS